MNFIKYMAGSFIISFGILFVIVLMLISLQVKAPDNVVAYLAGAWVLLSLAMYPLAKRIVRL